MRRKRGWDPVRWVQQTRCVLVMMHLLSDGVRGRGGCFAPWSLTETLVFGERCDGRESGSTLGALDLETTGRVHTLVATEVRELGVSFEADFTSERLDAGVDVSVLLETGAGGESLSTLGTGVAAGTDVLGADVSLEVRRIGEDFATGFTDVASGVVVSDLVSDQIGLPVVDFGTLAALVFLLPAA